MRYSLIVVCILLLCLYAYLNYNELKCVKPILLNRKTGSRIYVSMTTIPERISAGKLEKNLKSLKNQTLKPDFIYINIAPQTIKGSSYDMDKLNSLAKIYDVKINVIEKDLGPVTKLVPILNIAKEDDYIVLVDDDVQYDPNLIKTLYDSEIDAVGFTGRRLMNYINDVKCPRKVDFLETYNGVMYRAGLFSGFTEYNNKLGNTCLFQDDIKIGKYLRSKKIPRYVIPNNLNNIHDGIGTPQLRDNNLLSDNHKCYNNIW